MFAVLDLIPDSWQTGPLNEIIMIGAVLLALAAIGKTVVIPTWRWIKRIVVGIETVAARLSDVSEHEDRLDKIEESIGDIREALRPTNGDRRSISDRLDTVKQQTNKNADEIAALRAELSAPINKELKSE